MYKNQITIGGVPGSGKTTCGKKLAKILGYEFNSIGTIRRKIAYEKFGISINELNFLEEKKMNLGELIKNIKLNEAEKLGINKKLYPVFKKLQYIDSDKLVDDEQKRMSKSSENIIVEGRLAWKFFPKSIKFYFDCSLNESAKRIFNDPRTSENYGSLRETKLALKKRMDSDMNRYLSKYGPNHNVYEHSNFDIIINTTKLSRSEIINKVLTYYNKLIKK